MKFTNKVFMLSLSMVLIDKNLYIGLQSTDNEKGKILEYKGRELSITDLDKTNGASEIIASSCKDGWKVQNIIYRENGIININYRLTYSNGAYDCKYDTLRVTYNTQHKINRVSMDHSEDPADNSGEYMLSLTDSTN